MWFMKINNVYVPMLLSNERIKKMDLDSTFTVTRPAKYSDRLWNCMSIDQCENKYSKFESLFNNGIYFNKFSNYTSSHINATELTSKTFYNGNTTGFTDESMFISCWMNHPKLTEQHFLCYAQENGIAVGTTVEKLIAYCEGGSVVFGKGEDNYYTDGENTLPVSAETIYVGNVQYLNFSEAIKNNKIPASSVIPFFLKENYYVSDKEYRICIHGNSLASYYYIKNNNGIASLIDTIVCSTDTIKKIVPFLSKKGLSVDGGTAIAIDNNNSDSAIKCFKVKSINKCEVKSVSLFGGKYDSMKQHKILTNYNRLKSYLTYVATLRLELILTGRIILTDAMFLDGMLFAWMSEDKRPGTKNELTAFLNFAEKFQALELRCRKVSADNIAVKMFHKPFYLSVLECDLFSGMIYDFTKQYGESIRFKKLKDIIKIWDERKTHIYGESLNNEWKSFITREEQLFNCVDKYENLVFEWKNEDNGFKFNDVFNCMNKEIVPGFTNISYRDLLSDKYQNASRKCFGDKSKLSKILNRYVLDNLSNIRSASKASIELLYSNLKFNDECNSKEREDVRNLCISCQQIYNDRYCKTLAFQHCADLIDVCEYPDAINNASSKVEIKKVSVISSNALHCISTMSWSEFADLFDKLKCFRYNLYKGYNSSIGTYSFKKSLNKLISEINIYCKIGNYFNSIDLNNGPWNPGNAFHYDASDTVINSVIGNGHDTNPDDMTNTKDDSDKEFGNEICILKEKVLFRIPVVNNVLSNDTDYDTIIAPVDNIFNNGKL